MLTATITGCNNNINYPAGGYAYAAAIEDSNFYWYPLRDSINKQHKPAQPYDFLYRFFDEPNLSLRPMAEETFRFFLVGFKQWPLIIVLTEKQIVVKKAGAEDFWVKDSSKFTAIEWQHYQMLFDAGSSVHAIAYSTAKSYDSITNIYPQIRDKKYRHYLKEKAVNIPNKQFKYSTKIIPISKKQYQQLVNGINNSGYWQLPYFVQPSESYTDGFESILQVNTLSKYKVVSAASINNQKQYAKACQALINAAAMGKEYRAYGETGN